MTMVTTRSSFRVVASVVAMLFAADGSAGELMRETRELPDIGAPPGGQAFWIARAMRLNGLPMTIKSFASPANAAEVLSYYERRLRTGDHVESKRTVDENWQALAIRSPGYYVTIRAHDTRRGAEGTIAVSPALAHVSASTRTKFPHPATARVVNLQQYDDDGVEAEHISLVSVRSVAIEAHEFAAQLAREDWQILRSEVTTDRRGHVIEAQKAASLAFINLQRLPPGGDTSIMVVWKKT
jgi:hypothetical protein